MIRHRIEFRLDGDKPPHAELLGCIDDLIGRDAEDEKAERAIRSLTVSIMESEWRRVRREVGATVSADLIAVSGAPGALAADGETAYPTRS